MYNRLGTIPACDRQTDRQTDILPRHSPRYAYASRGKNAINIVICLRYISLYTLCPKKAVDQTHGDSFVNS